MAKLPAPGRVKTRLAAETGPVAAAWWARHSLARLVRRIGRDRRWRLVLAVAPDAEAGSRALPPVPRMAQGGGDLGWRMLWAMAAHPAAQVLVVGADIPGIDAARVARAFGAMRGADGVLGPAEDGGYWAIGLRRGGLARGLSLDGVRWSGPDALADTEAALAPLRVARADRLADVDTAADLRALGDPWGAVRGRGRCGA